MGTLTERHRQDRALVNSGQSVRRAITHYARAAAYEEHCGEGNSAQQMWFVVRALCNEHGVNYDEQIRFARQFTYDTL